jgi:hypothetical protein
VRIELAATYGKKLKVSELERLERETAIDPMQALFVRVLPDGPVDFGGSSWLTSRKSTLSAAVVSDGKRATPSACRDYRAGESNRLGVSV